MTKTLAAGLAMAAILAFASAVSAEEVSGTIKSYDASARTVTLSDGRNYILDQGLSDQQVKGGTKVKFVFEKRKGKKVVTQILPAE